MSKELTANGKLRVGVAFAPAPTPLFIVKDADGTPRGVTVDLGNALAKEFGVGAEFMVADNLSIKAQYEYHWDTDAVGSSAHVGKIGLNWHF